MKRFITMLIVSMFLVVPNAIARPDWTISETQQVDKALDVSFMGYVLETKPIEPLVKYDLNELTREYPEYHPAEVKDTHKTKAKEIHAKIVEEWSTPGGTPFSEEWWAQQLADEERMAGGN
jgi:hypothetical protein